MGKDFLRKIIMSINLTYDVANIRIQSYLDNSTTSYQKTIERLSSGSKFTTVGDDPIGVTRTARLTSRITANDRALSNVELGEDLLNMAESNQELVISDLQRIRDLCLQAATGTYSNKDKDDILQEIKLRLTNIDNIAETTKFNNIQLLNGDSSNMSLQVGTTASSTFEVGSALINVHVSQLGVDTNKDLRIEDTVTGDTWTTTDIHTYLDKIDSAINQLTGTTVQIGSFLNRLDNIQSSLSSMKEKLINNKSIISDVDVAEASADLVKYQVLQDASTSILTQANQIPSMALNLLD